MEHIEFCEFICKISARANLYPVFVDSKDENEVSKWTQERRAELPLHMKLESMVKRLC